MGQLQSKKSERSELKTSDVDFLLEKTGMSKDEVKEKYEHFIAAHGKGKMNKTEFIAYFQRTWNNGNSDLSWLAERVFTAYDINQDQLIDFKEFSLWLHTYIEGDPKDKLLHMFKVFDEDNNGTISRQEFIKIVRHLMHIQNIFKSRESMMSAEKEDEDEDEEAIFWRTLIKDYDWDFSETISKQEFLEICEDDFGFMNLLNGVL